MSSLSCKVCHLPFPDISLISTVTRLEQMGHFQPQCNARVGDRKRATTATGGWAGDHYSLAAQSLIERGRLQPPGLHTGLVPGLSENDILYH